MSSFLQPSYWLTMQPPIVDGTLGTVVFVIFLAFFVLGIVGRIVADRRGGDRLAHKVSERLSTFLVVMGLFGVILFFFSYERIQLFGARFWYPLWLLATLVWAGILFRFVKRDIPAMRERSVMRRLRDKYLPGRRAS